MPRQRHQMVLLSTAASLRGQNKGNKSYFLALGASLRCQDNGNKWFFLALGHRFQDRLVQEGLERHEVVEEARAGLRVTKRHILPKTVVIVIGWLRWLGWAALLGFSWAGLGCGLGFLALGHHFETKTTATNRTSQYWGITSMPKQQQQQQIVLLSAGASLRAKATEIHDTSWH